MSAYSRTLSFILVCILVLSGNAVSQIGAVDREFATPGNCRPSGMTWDGTHLWQVDYTNDRIMKLDPATGAVLTSFAAPDDMVTGLAWQDSVLWCTGRTGDMIFKLDTTGTVLASFPVTPDPRGAEFFDGGIWYVDSGLMLIFKHDPATFAPLDTIPAPAGACRGIAFDGTNLWCADCSLEEIYKIDVTRKKVTMIIPSPGEYTYGLAWDGECLWTCGYDSRRTYRLRTTGANRTTVLDSTRYHIQYRLGVRNVGSSSMSLQTWMCKPVNSIGQTIIGDIGWSPLPRSFTNDQWGQEFAYYKHDRLSRGQRGLLDVGERIAQGTSGGISTRTASVRCRTSRRIYWPIIRSTERISLSMTRSYRTPLQKRQEAKRTCTGRYGTFTTISLAGCTTR